MNIRDSLLITSGTAWGCGTTGLFVHYGWTPMWPEPTAWFFVALTLTCMIGAALIGPGTHK